ncbi:MAG: 3-dehydro-L-gulonate 2-dehydrogenase [Alkalispirochaeta sp.]
MRVAFDDLKAEMKRVLVSHGFSHPRAEHSAEMFAWNSADGIASHGANRFPRVISYLEKGYIDVDAEPVLVKSLGAIEQWDGKLGMGNLNAHFCMDRAIELARDHGIGAVALRNTNHWMRGGAYGWQAAEAGFAGLCWTNTQPNMPPWGSTERKIGNNPVVFAVPRTDASIVVDAAVAQYSYGKIEQTAMAKESLPFPGGFDADGNLTSDRVAIQQTWRVLPMGYWKGSGLSIVLDLLATVLSGGNSVYEVGKLGGDEYGLSQVFIAMDVSRLSDREWAERTIDATLADIKQSERDDPDTEIRYPGERELRTRAESLAQGVVIDEAVWQKIQAL